MCMLQIPMYLWYWGKKILNVIVCTRVVGKSHIKRPTLANVAAQVQPQHSFKALGKLPLP